jgi:hypothetical protein
MKSKAIIACVALIMLFVSPVFGDAAGTFFGTASTANSVGMGHGSFQGVVGIADATSFYGAFRYGFSDFTQGRIKLGMADDEGIDASLIFGADFMYQFWKVNTQAKQQGQTTQPFDMAFQGFIEYGDFDYFSVLEVGGGVIGSYPFVMQNGHKLSPYGRLNIRMEKLSVDVGPVNGDDTNLEFGLNGGVHYQFTSSIGGYAEFQIDGNDGLFIGLDFLTM